MLRPIRKLLGFVQRAAWKAANISILLPGWGLRPVSMDRALLSDLEKLRTRARDLEMNSPLIRQYLALLTNNVIGPTGLKLQAQVRNNGGNLNRAFNDKIEAAWNRWGRTCSADGLLDLTEFQSLALRAVARDGECFVRLVPGYANECGFALQLIDADLVDTTLNRPAGREGNEIRLGVEVTPFGRPVAYHVFTRPPDDVTGLGSRKTARIPAEEIVHLYRPDRPGQTRGATWLASIMHTVKVMDGYVEAELTAARTGAAKMGFLKPSAEVYDPPNKDASIVPSMDGTPGKIPVLPPGVDFEPWAPDHPAAAFGEFVKACVRQICSGLQVSYSAMSCDLTAASYGSMRTGLLIERDQWRVLQDWWISRFLLPVYAEWIKYALLSGAVILDSRDFRKFLDVKFYPRGWAWIDPLKDAQAAVLQIQNKLGTKSEALAEKGVDFETICETLEREQKLEKEYGLAPEPPPTPPAPGKPQENDDSTEAKDGPKE